MYSRQFMITIFEDQITDIRLFWENLGYLNPETYVVILHNKNCSAHYHVFLKFNSPINIDVISETFDYLKLDLIYGGKNNVLNVIKYLLQIDKPIEYQYSILDLRTNLDLATIAKKLCI